jgi:mRNA-degrading endonuclease RelE of RelBE toxin-antitoxin system
MPFRLFIDLEAIEFLQSLKGQQRARLLSHLHAIREYPGNHMHHRKMHSSGRMLGVSLIAGYAISYWIDDADKHVKIMKIEPRIGL